MDDQHADVQKQREKFYQNPDDAAAELAYGKLLYGQQKLDSVSSAFLLFRNVTIKQPENPEGHECLGMTYTFFARFEDAARCFNKAAALCSKTAALNGQGAPLPAVPVNER